jgi:hypothetical protein
MSKYKRWESLMNSQSGFETSRPDGSTVIEFKPRNVLSSRIDSSVDFVFGFQIPEDVVFELVLKNAECSFENRLPCKLMGGASGFYDIETQLPIRCKISPGDVLDLELVASWVCTKKQPKSQTLLGGEFLVPNTMDLFGAPGYRLYVANLDACAYLGVGNVIDKVTEQANLEVLSFHIKLKFG